MDRYSTPKSSTGSARLVMITAVVAFFVGAILVGYLYNREGYVTKTAAEGEPAPEETAVGGIASLLPTPEEEAEAAEENPEEIPEPAVRRVVQQAGGLDQRLAAAEQRIARLDLQAQAAAGNASRAESLLIAFASRRALERGDDLGYLASQLQLRFADYRPNAVRAVLDAGDDPVTVDELAARLEGLAPSLRDAPGESTLEFLRREISELFVIRRESTPSPNHERRLERAAFFLQSGRLENAAEEVEKLPGADQEAAQGWITDARRMARAFEALDLLEGAAILDSGTVRSGSGETIEQPSPAGEGGQP